MAENIGSPLVSGSNLMVWDIEQITDANPVREQIINTQELGGLVIDIASDKGCVIEATPILSLDEVTSVGPTVQLGMLEVGGGLARYTRMLVASPVMRITVTKTEAGDTSTYRNSIRGIVGGIGMQLENEALPVVIQDQTSPTLILPMNKIIHSTFLAADATIYDQSLTVNDATGFINGQALYIVNPDTNRYYHGHIIAVPIGNILQLDTPLDSDFPAGTQSEVLSAAENMAVDGSVTTQVYTLRGGDPGLNFTIDITRIIIICETNSIGDLSEFGDLPALLKGIVFRRVDGRNHNILNAKTNGDLASYAYDFTHYEASNPNQGINGFACRLTFAGSSKVGVALRVGPFDDLQMLIQDDLSALVSLKVILEGHEVV